MEEQMITVGQLMKKDLVTVDAGTSVVEAAKLMKACNVGSVLISREGRVIGIVTESDIVKKVVGSDRAPYFIPVEDIMSSPIVGIEERRPLTDAADLMNRHQTRHLGVTKGGTVVGILSVRDLLRPVSVDEF
jgi:CBS domain-containing protein